MAEDRSVAATVDRRALRHESTRQEILAAAWALARERGLTGWTLREVAAAVGMRAPSLYGYFASKGAIYDAMFAQGYAAVLDRFEGLDASEPAAALRASARGFVDFCVEDPARFQLLFLRTIPGFTPSVASYALARRAFDRLVAVLADVGAGSAEAVDLWTAMLTGLASQQISNDPGGDRWIRLVDRAVDDFLAIHAAAS